MINPFANIYTPSYSLKDVKSGTVAVDKKTGKTGQELREYGLTVNTKTRNLEDHKFVKKSNGFWYDVGKVNNEKKYKRGDLADDYVQNKFK